MRVLRSKLIFPCSTLEYLGKVSFLKIRLRTRNMKRRRKWENIFWLVTGILTIKLFPLSGPENSYTDWHIDMAGSSVWYHVVSGGKLFILVKPTEQNLDKYKDWESHEAKVRRRYSFLEWCEKEKNPIDADEIIRMELNPGETLLLPGLMLTNLQS